MDQVARRYGFEPNRAGYIQCPFHKEKTASLKLYSGAGGWHCFGCGKGGTVIDFTMELFSISFHQAVVRLDADFGLGLTSERPSPAQRSKALEERSRAQREKERREAEYRALARERLYWCEVEQYFAPVLGENGFVWVHSLYAQAVRELPWLEYRLDELTNEMEEARRAHE